MSLQCTVCYLHAPHKIVHSVVFLRPYTTSFKVKYSLDQSRAFKGPPTIHLVRSIIVKASEARMDPIEDMPEKKILAPHSAWGAIHDGKNMASGITIWCHGNGSNIGDYKLSLPKSRLQPKSQGWARLSKVWKIVAQSEGQVGKSKLVVVFSFLEADAAKPRTRSCTRTSRASGKH